MNYYFSKIINTDFNKAIDKVTGELKKQGFGIVSEIDVKKTLKKKLNIDFKKYKILGACNPKFAHQALKAEDKIGLMLPCNVVVEEISSDKTEVSVADPITLMQAIINPELKHIAKQVQVKLKKVVENL
jgi:uncharacterized protein (DUF302 family)